MDADFLDKVAAAAQTVEGRAALAARGLTTTATAGVPVAQSAAPEPQEADIERLIATFPQHLHAVLAKRLVQPGVQATPQPPDQQPQQPQPQPQQQQQRGREPTRESSSERRARLGSRSRSPCG